jgi:hypothetical protein
MNEYDDDKYIQICTHIGEWIHINININFVVVVVLDTMRTLLVENIKRLWLPGHQLLSFVYLALS